MIDKSQGKIFLEGS